MYVECLFYVYAQCVLYTYITRVTSSIFAGYINTEFRYIVGRSERGLTGAPHGLQYVLGKLPDYVTSRMVTRYYNAGTVPFGHRYAYLGRFLPDNLCKVTYGCGKQNRDMVIFVKIEYYVCSICFRILHMKVIYFLQYIFPLILTCIENFRLDAELVLLLLGIPLGDDLPRGDDQLGIGALHRIDVFAVRRRRLRYQFVCVQQRVRPGLRTIKRCETTNLHRGHDFYVAFYGPIVYLVRKKQPANARKNAEAGTLIASTTPRRSHDNPVHSEITLAAAVNSGLSLKSGTRCFLRYSL